MSYDVVKKPMLDKALNREIISLKYPNYILDSPITDTCVIG
jgi:hypothetical protein